MVEDHGTTMSIVPLSGVPEWFAPAMDTAPTLGIMCVSLDLRRRTNKRA
jgi:hypothetical protein